MTLRCDAREIEQYLKRINYDGPREPNASVLRDIHYAHIHAVPYENLDIVRGVALSLEIPDLYDKIVVRGRGGYCFEVNALFAWLLRGLGYDVADYFARFWRGETRFPKRRHHMLRVETEKGPHICDVGVGTGVSRVPLLLAEGLEQEHGGDTYRLIKDAELGWVVEDLYHGEWSRVYSFTEEKQFPVDYDAANYFCQHSPDSIFNKGAMVAMYTREGRNTVSGDEFRVFTREEVTTFKPEKGDEWNEALKKYFGITM